MLLLFFDKESDSLFLARDRFGVRPLFYAVSDKAFYFASSTAVLAKHLGLKPNLHYLARGLKYLVYEDGSELTAYEGLQSLPASAYLELNAKAPGQRSEKLNYYYNVESAVKQKMQELPLDNLPALLELLSSSFERAVALRLRSDVPLGISLSSGLDSSSVASLTRKQHAATIGFFF